VSVGILVKNENNPEMAVLLEAVDGEGREVRGQDDLAAR
jgi:hypothetical protein